MAILTGISYRTWQNYEDGVNPPSWDACLALVNLGFNLNWLLTGDGTMLMENSQVNSVTGSQVIGFASGGKVVEINNGVVGVSTYADDIREIADLLEEHFSKAFRKKLLLELIEKKE